MNSSSNKTNAVSISEKRKNLRFEADPNSLAKIDLEPSLEHFSPSIFALVIDESSHGCGIVTLHSDHLFVGREIRIAVGRLDPMVATIKSIREPEPKVVIIGCEYME